ncbi:MAG: inorganic phosphate transporter [bacterium]|nr:inorganic phosphate transporter [bacterium]
MFFFTNIIYYLGAVFLGWGLGANDSANVFGTAVSSQMVRYRIAVLCTAFFVILGAVVQGSKGIETIAFSLTDKTNISSNNSTPKLNNIVSNQKLNAFKKKLALEKAMIISFAAAFAVFIMTLLKLPVSTSQAIVGAIIGFGLMQADINIRGFEKIVLCWIGTPIGGMLFTYIFYYFFKMIFNLWKPSIFQFDAIIKTLLIITGCYGAYALGANNVANVTAVFVKAGALSVNQAAWFGGIAIAFGVMSYSKPVMLTVGKGIAKLDSFTAFIAVLSLSVTVYIYALIGVPVSTTQAIVGAVLGIGFIKGSQIINFKTLKNIGVGWVSTPILAAFLAILAFFMSSFNI